MRAYQEAAREKLSAVRQARKRSEHDVQLLTNRIALLKSEEVKTIRSTEQLRQRTREITESRQQLEARFREQETARRQQAEEEETRRRRNASIRAQGRAARAEAVNALESSRKASAVEIRTKSVEQRSAAERAPSREGSYSARRQLKDGSDGESSTTSRKAAFPPAQQRGRSVDGLATAAQFQREEKELLSRLNFVAKAAGRPPRLALEDNSSVRSGSNVGSDDGYCPSSRIRARSYALASARSAFAADLAAAGDRIICTSCGASPAPVLVRA